jgi:hypothetical protein
LLCVTRDFPAIIPAEHSADNHEGMLKFEGVFRKDFAAK